MPDAPDYLTEAQVARHLLLSPATLKRWRNKRQGPPYTHVGNAVRYSRAALLEWLEARVVHPTN